MQRHACCAACCAACCTAWRGRTHCIPRRPRRKLTELINERHENVKYLPGVQLGDNVVACADLIETVK